MQITSTLGAFLKTQTPTVITTEIAFAALIFRRLVPPFKRRALGASGEGSTKKAKGQNLGDCALAALVAVTLWVFRLLPFLICAPYHGCVGGMNRIRAAYRKTFRLNNSILLQIITDISSFLGFGKAWKKCMTKKLLPLQHRMARRKGRRSLNWLTLHFVILVAMRKAMKVAVIALVIGALAMAVISPTAATSGSLTTVVTAFNKSCGNAMTSVVGFFHENIRLVETSLAITLSACGLWLLVRDRIKNKRSKQTNDSPMQPFGFQFGLIPS